MGIQRSDFLEYLSLSDKIESEYSGIEADAEDDEECLDIDDPYEVQSIRIAQKMITVFQIEHWISAESGVRLNLRPEYQRNMVWDDVRKSALIESLLLRIPIPSFYLDEDTEGNKSVIDGMQRLSAIHSYLNNEFPLKRMQYLPQCEKTYFRDLEPKLQGRIEDTELAVNILDERCPRIVKFDVFRRVNTGGLPLNSQEIRNIMASPKVRTFLQKMAECEAFQLATHNSVRDLRMGAQELCLRYLTIFAFYDWKSHDIKQYCGLVKMMDYTILVLNDRTNKSLYNLLWLFEEIMKYCRYFLGECAFCKTNSNKINKSLFTGWAVVLAKIIMESGIDGTKVNSEKLRSLYRERLSKDTDFFNAITSSTGTKKHILLSIEVIRELWEECYDKVD